MNRLSYEMEELKIRTTDLASAIGKVEKTVLNYRDGSTTPPIDIAVKISEYIAEKYGKEIPVEELFKEVEVTTK